MNCSYETTTISLRTEPIPGARFSSELNIPLLVSGNFHDLSLFQGAFMIYGVGIFTSMIIMASELMKNKKNDQEELEEVMSNQMNPRKESNYN